MSGFTFWVPGVPVPQGSMRIVKGRAVHGSPRLANWRAKVSVKAYQQARLQGWPVPFDGPVAVRAVFVLPRPKTVKRSFPCVKPDLDKLMRAVGDALSLGAWAVLSEDSRIVRWAGAKKYADADEMETPGVMVTLSRIGEGGEES